MSYDEEFLGQEDLETEEIMTEPESVDVDTEETAAEEVSDENAESEKKKEDWRKRLFKDMRDILVLLAVFMLVYVLFFRVVVVKGSSMNDTLVDGDRLLLISGLLYNDPNQGDVIVAAKDTFKEGEPIIKRIVATEGQTVDIDFKTGTVYVDGVALVEDYISTPTTDFEGVHFPLTVPDGCVFVMGDNRGDSMDSRSPQIGFIDEREILGKAVFLLIPGTGKGDYPFDLTRIGVVN